MEQRECAELREQASRLNTRDFIAWTQRVDEVIKLLEEQNRNNEHLRLLSGLQQSLINNIAELESLKDSVSRRFVHVGAEFDARLRWREIDTAFKRRILTGAVINSKHIDPRQFLEDAREIVFEHVQNFRETHNSIKINTIFNGEFESGDKRANKSVATKNSELFRCTDLREWYDSRVVESTLASLEEFQERDSGWKLLRILNLIVNINKHNPLHAGCHIKLPREIILKKAVVNIKDTGNACFAWAVVAALHPAESNVSLKSSYPYYKDVLNFKDIEFP
ncbi:PREDICTED: uncharacterized protein LOC105457737, partial [Wasmannia auropunctata]|uniref:uncharacterized protein LOC105457737 n=1 Tax=Wasmannia auropunctata TaxID=64793 RepID=UPI0005ED5862